MSEKMIEKQLRQYGKETKSLRSPHRDEKVWKLLDLAQKETRFSFADFAIEQLGFLGRYSLIWEMLWLVVFCFLMNQNIPLMGTDQSLLMISMFSPLLIIILALDLGKVMNRGLLEIEMTTRYSLARILIFRLIVHELLQLLLILVGILLFYKELGQPLLVTLLYGYTPFIISSSALLICISRFSGETLQFAGGAIAILLIVLLFVLRIYNIFGDHNIGFWLVLFVAGCAVGILELLKIRNEVKKNGIGTLRCFEML